VASRSACSKGVTTLAQGHWENVERHRLLGLPMVSWDGENVVLVPPEELPHPFEADELASGS
jgi:hypothetical protein